MESGSEVCDRPWATLLPDVLALIFKKTSFQEILTVVPAVCKSWRRVVSQPDYWQEIDIKEWCHRSTPEAVERMVEMLVKRSRGSMRKLSVFELANEENFALISNYSHNLQVLRIPGGQVTDSIVTQIAPKLANLTYLDISYCHKITCSSLESIGKHCKFLKRLSRCMREHCTLQRPEDPQDDEAFAIANNMPRLKRLDLINGLLTDAGVERLLSMCKELEHLDIRCCGKVAMKGSLAARCRKLKVFLEPGTLPSVLWWREHNQSITSDEYVYRDYFPFGYYQIIYELRDGEWGPGRIERL